MRISKAEAQRLVAGGVPSPVTPARARQRRRRARGVTLTSEVQATQAPDEMLRVFVAGILTNPMNGSHGHWSNHARWARAWRQRVMAQVYQAVLRGAPLGRTTSDAPKCVTFIVNTGAKWDDDNLRAGCKPIRDGLMDSMVTHSDAPDSGHEFLYRQQINRSRPGVLIVVALRKEYADAPGVLVEVEALEGERI